MAKKNSLILCSFLVLLIIFAATDEDKRDNTTCNEETWETPCVTEEDCQDKCFSDHGSSATPSC
ncbi:hypothetical protein MKW94_002571 [Papaver nudicaule]|uniref:Uncharacterized protein n=1 Tax=Papaver nudicaule TaxID=74823 RepID=A0AA41VCS3_PAPNU|nr:hypothetical protein [Papaver nudicaule]